MKKDSIEKKDALPEEQAVVAEPAVDSSEEIETVVLDDASFSDAPADAVIAEEAPVQKTEEAPAPAEQKPAPGYGAPQMLYEDFIPFEYLQNTAPAKKEEKPKAEEAPAPKKEKPKKPSKEDAILAEVEAEMAAQQVAAEQPVAEEDLVVIKDPIEEEPVAPVKEKVTPVVPVAPVTPVKEEKEEAVMAENKKEKNKYTSYERRLRRKYKLDKDILLSNNDIVPGFILAKGENVIRSYNCLASKKGEGTICLTNKRLMINADERSEVEVEKVSGIKFSRNTYFSFAKFLFGLIFLGLGAFMIMLPFFHTGMNIPYITGEAWKSWFFYLFIACGAVSVLIGLPLWGTMVKKYFYFNIFIKEGSPFLECKSKSFVKSEKKGRQYTFLVSNAGKESEKAARELGALIIEVKEGRYNF